MRIAKIFSLQLDGLGACVSSLCLVHCLSLPLLLAFAPTLAHAIPGDEVVHRLLALVVMSVGVPSFWSGFRRHRKPLVLVAGLAGMGTILGALMLGDLFKSHAAEIATTMLGSLLLTTAHLTNRTFCRRCNHCNP